MPAQNKQTQGRFWFRWSRSGATRRTTNWSFADLEQRSTVTPAMLIEALEQYAFGGWSINPDVVLKLIHRAKPTLTPVDKKRLADAAAAGASNQQSRQQHKCAAEYRQVLDSYLLR